MNLEQKIAETMDAMFLYTDDENYHVEQIKKIIADCLRECRPERGVLGENAYSADNRKGRSDCLDEYEQLAEQLLGEKLQ